MRIQKSSRPGVILMATVVAIITSMVAANATQTFITPNEASVSYSLVAGANSPPITPATNKPVLVMGCCTTSGHQGVGQVNLLHLPSTGMLWFGLETTNPATTTAGFSPTAGIHILYIDATETVDIQVNSADTIRIHNRSAGTLAGNVTLVW